jgi:TonB family protein
MKQRLLLIICVLLFVVAANAQTPNTAKAVSWQNYTVDGEKFSVALPLLPAMHLNSLYRDRWDKERRIVQLGSYADGVVYTVFALENPSPTLSLEEFIAQQNAGSAWHPDSQHTVTRQGFAGKVFTSTDPNDGMAQFFATEDHLYAFRAFGAPAEDARLTRFFSSASFSKTKDAVEVKEGPGLPFEQASQEERPETQLPYKAFLGKDVTRKARLAMKPEPSYTEAARQNAVSGTVVLKCIFRYDGSVTDIRTVSGLPYGLTERAIRAARSIKFIPAVKDGKYVSMWMQLEYNFNLY